ncbi:MAG: hypothetical protein DWQ49_09965 [Bacteroidetes bacterium]|nr:MAG: hypothetical protein DWQ49_09965 [Bacteroidota bacterium]
MDNAQICKEFAAHVTARQNINGLFDLTERYVVPFRTEVYTQVTSENVVNWRDRGIFDGTAITANEILSSSIHGSLTSMATKWFSLRFRQDELNEDYDAMLWAQESEDIIFETLQDSNFDVETSEFYLDLTSFGTSIITEEIESELSWEGVTFNAIPINNCYFDVDFKGKVCKFFRKIEWTKSEIKTKFKLEDEQLPDCLKNQQDQTKKHTIIFCIYKRNYKYEDTGEKLAPKSRPYGFKYVLEQDKEILGEEGGYYEMPSYVTRWRKSSVSNWGFSPAFVAMPDILTVNQITEDTLEALGKVIDPATLTTRRGLLSDLDLGRAGLTVVRSMDDIKPYESNARFDVGEVKIKNLQDAINRAFHVNQLMLKDSPAMTATEVQVRYELMQRLLGPTLGRLQNDFLDPLVKRTFNALYRSGQLPKMPQIVEDMQGYMNIEYVGPMARAQKRQVAVSMLNWIGNIGQYAEVFPEALDIPDVDKITRELGTLEGVSAKFMRSVSDIDKRRKEREAQIQERMAAEQLGAEGEARKVQAEANVIEQEAVNE